MDGLPRLAVSPVRPRSLPEALISESLRRLAAEAATSAFVPAVRLRETRASAPRGGSRCRASVFLSVLPQAYPDWRSLLNNGTIRRACRRVQPDHDRLSHIR